jgi:hypothetical protein
VTAPRARASSGGPPQCSPPPITTVQRELLRSPLNLTLLNAITEQGQAPAFEKTRELMDLFWGASVGSVASTPGPMCGSNW